MTAGDFELIPHVRAVLALDDFDFAGDAKTEKFPAFDFDDWEHVESCSSSSVRAVWNCRASSLPCRKVS